MFAQIRAAMSGRCCSNLDRQSAGESSGKAKALAARLPRLLPERDLCYPGIGRYVDFGDLSIIRRLPYDNATGLAAEREGGFQPLSNGIGAV